MEVQDCSDCSQTSKGSLNQFLFTWFDSFLPPISSLWTECMWCFTKWLVAMLKDMPKSRILTLIPTLPFLYPTWAFPKNQCCVNLLYGELARAMWVSFFWLLDYVMKDERKQKSKRNGMIDDCLMWSKPASVIKSFGLKPKGLNFTYNVCLG